MKSYISGFIISLILTLTAFALVSQYIGSDHEAMSRSLLIPIVIGLAITQLIVQLIFFLHLGRERKPRLNLTAFLFMLLVVVLLVGGSLWIMANLDYHDMHNKNVEKNIVRDEGIEH